MQYFRRVLPLSLALAAAGPTPASAQFLGKLLVPKTWDQVRVPLMAEAVAPEGMAERTAATNEPFLQRRLSALKSVTLQSDVDAAHMGGRAAWPKGTRLIYARGQRGDYYCGTHAPAIPGLAYKLQWVCLRDENADGVFDAWHPAQANPGAFLPAFGAVLDPKPIQAAYTPDPEPDYFESAVVQQNTFNFYGRIFFWQKVRRRGEERWNDVASNSRGVVGGFVSVPGKPLPQTVSLAGVTFAVLDKTSAGVTIRPGAVETGIMTFGLSTTYR